MTQHHDSKQFKIKTQLSGSVGLTLALGALVGFGGTAAHAGLTIFNPATGTIALLGPNSTTTVPYTLGNAFQVIPSPYTVALGNTNQVTFTATAEPTGATAFEGFRNQISPLTNTAFDFPIDTHLIDTFDPFTQSPTGPLEIDFSAPVGSFGFKSQSSRTDLEQFTFSVYDASNNLLGSSTTQIFDNTVTPYGKSVFLGAASTSDDISKVVISSLSDASGYHGGDNDFYTGPVSVGAPVPEASTEVSFGLLLMGGLAWAAFKRKAKSAL